MSAPLKILMAFFNKMFELRICDRCTEVQSHLGELNSDRSDYVLTNLNFRRSSDELLSTFAISRLLMIDLKFKFLVFEMREELLWTRFCNKIIMSERILINELRVTRE